MKDFIQLPAIVKAVNEIYSENLEKLVQNSNVQKNKISLDYLRELYKTDRDFFVKIVDELSLRGFSFSTDKPNNILPNYSPHISSYIVAEEDHGRYEKLDFIRLGLSGLLKRFNVDSDLFFHNIPIRGFKLMNANIHIEELETEFMNAGFIIENRDKSQKKAIKKNVIEGSHSLEVSLKYVNNKKQLINTSINELFKENKFNSFRGFCTYKEISSILDVSETLIKEYSQMRQVGQGKVRAVEERLAEVLNSKMDCELPEKTLDTKEGNLQFDNRYASEMEISQLFQESRYIKFREFCQEEGVRFVRQIRNEHLAAFSSLPGIGKKKVRDVLVLLNRHTKLAANTPSKFHSGELFKYIQYMKVTSLLDSYSFQTTSRSSLIIADIEGKSFEELETEFNRKTLLEVSSRLGQQKLPKTIVNEIRSVLSEREIKIIESRFIERLTLEETAKFFDVTRERIRQIEARALKRIFQHLEMNQFYFVAILLSSSNTLVTKSELIAFVGEENNFLIEVLKSKNGFFSYFEKLDVFFYNVEDHITLNLIDDFIVELPENFYLFEYESMLKEVMGKLGILDLTIEMIEELLRNYGLNKYGELYSKSKLHISDVLEHLFRMYIKNPLRIDKEGIEKLQMLALRHLDYHLEGSLRSIEARIRDANNVILVDKSTYQWFDGESFDRNIVSIISDYLQKRFLEVKVINIEEVFKRFEKLLEPFNISNKLHLYSIVKYFLEEEYSIGKGNTLNIFKNDNDKPDAETIVANAIKKIGGSCDKRDLQEILKWPMYRIDLTISSSYKLVPWGENQVILFDDIGLTDEQKAGLLNLVNRSITEGYTSIGVVYKELMFDRHLSALISQNGIDNKSKLAAIIKILKPTLRGHTNFMYEEGCMFTSFEEVILHHFNQGASRREIQNFAIEHGYGDIMAGNLLSRLIEQGELIELDFDLLYPAHAFEIPEEAVNQLIHFIEEQMGSKEYISLSSLKGYRRKLPSINFRWNPYLIKSVLLKNNYRQINKIYRDYRYDRVLLVKKDSKIQTFEELVHFVLREEYSGNMHEVNVYDFLVEKGVFREQDYAHNKVLPHEIKGYSKLVNVNNIGIVTLG